MFEHAWIAEILCRVPVDSTDVMIVSNDVGLIRDCLSNCGEDEVIEFNSRYHQVSHEEEQNPISGWKPPNRWRGGRYLHPCIAHHFHLDLILPTVYSLD
jgi:hypothetical protein